LQRRSKAKYSAHRAILVLCEGNIPQETSSLYAHVGHNRRCFANFFVSHFHLAETAMSFEDIQNATPGLWMYDVQDQLKSHVYERSRAPFAAGDAARDALTT